jgi:hypothetical protein
MTSLFSLTQGEVLERELRQLEPARLRPAGKAQMRRLVGATNGYLCYRFQNYALAAATRRCQNCVAGNEA